MNRIRRLRRLSLACTLFAIYAAPLPTAFAAVGSIGEVRSVQLALKGAKLSVACEAAFAHRLGQEGVAVVDAGKDADARLEVTFSEPQSYYSAGPFLSSSGVAISYAATVTGAGEARLLSLFDEEDGDSAIEACDDAANDIVDELAEAIDDAR